MKKLVLILAFALVFSASFAMSEIVINEPLNTYNLGDRLYVEVDGLTGFNNGNLNIDLLCNDNITNLVKIPARAFSTEKEQTYSIPYKVLDTDDLEISNISSVVGECQILASIGTKSKATKTFTISDEINVEASLDKYAYDPGEQVKIEISAIKKNGRLLNGFVEMTNVTYLTKAVEEGSAEDVFVLPTSIEAGTYQLDVYAYDVGSDDILNEGRTSVEFSVNQIATSIIIGLSTSEAIPGEDLSISIDVFDQSGVNMNGEAYVKLVSPNEEEIELTIQSGDTEDVYFENNETPGVWKIYTTFDNLVQEREFEVIEVQKADFDLDGSVLSVTNIGNAVYNKTIEVKIGEELQDLKLRIGVGETRKFNLGAPRGEYDVLVNDGETSINKQVLLTGNAISVNDIRRHNIFRDFAILWIFLLIIMAAVAVILIRSRGKLKKSPLGEYTHKSNKKNGKTHFDFSKILSQIKSIVPRKVDHKKSTSEHTNKSNTQNIFESSNKKHENKSMIDLTGNRMMGAESTLVLKGKKHEASIVSMAIKNFQELTDNSKNSLKKIISESQSKGLVDWRADYVFLVFSPIITKTYHNEELACKAALNLKEKLSEHNKKFKDKIEFNIGVNNGDIVAMKEDGKLKYSSIGNTISFAKRMASADSGKVIISTSIRKKMLRDLRVHNSKDIGENKTYELAEVRDKTVDQQKLKELMKRME